MAGAGHAVAGGFGEQHRDRCRGAVSVFLNVVENLLCRDTHALRYGFVDSQIGLVEEEEIDVLEFLACRVEGFDQNLRHAGHRVLEDEAAFHTREVRRIRDQLRV